MHTQILIGHGFSASSSVVPPQNPVDRTIVDVFALGVQLAYPDAALAVRPARNRQIEPEAPARARSREPRVPPENLVDRTIVDVSALGDNSWPLCSERHLTAQHIPQLRDGTVPRLPEARLGWGNRPGCRGPRECRHGKGTREARTETWASVRCCRSLSERWPTPTMRSWNQFSAFIEEWDELWMAAR